MNLIKCFQTHSWWYQAAQRNSAPIGVLWHDTAAGNPGIKRYVQPYETDPDYDEMIAILGKNTGGNDWNHKKVGKGVNAFIGKIADGSVATCQCGEYSIHPWGCGAGSLGSCNGYTPDNKHWVNRHWIQFEICDDSQKNSAGKRDYSLGSKEYFESIYKEAVEFTAYLCKLYNIDPYGTVEFAGVKVPTILCHYDSHKFKLGSDHSDVLSWFKVYNKTMDDVRKDVYDLLNPKIVEYVVSIGTYRNKSEAESVKNSLKIMGIDSKVVEL